ncbi:MAG: LapA family protein [Rhodoferax sp.]|nr:LapA family protein [Rhodoferax sp.]NCP54897.1 LapA family protein [Rhodoferax sp.]OIP21981.1 MAG: Signal transduction histidine kinase [Comamonadaceae bacterium CG2_30_60_41]PIW09079.1 MAG: Signal transduction histidine kinase [Comamonadaceae bacterium CG17_big_fil_post_rev_8_21_14_2_50_60_13]PJC11776.1 MAG: Signal transduction histidine kinase [Comamonadaceae bacterium CG_4_9_14_0_8_um_filter_60_18]
MKLRSLFMLLVLVAIAGFTVLNWSAILTPTSLNLGVADVQAPLGLIMLGLVVFLIALFLVYVLYLQTTVMFDARANAKELAANRKLADQAEASRFTTLTERIDRLEKDLKLAIEQSGNSVAAAIAEMDDRLKR